MASAVVVGLAALLCEAASHRGVDEIEQALLATHQPVVAEQAHRVRLGHVDANRALAWLGEQPTKQREPTASTRQAVATRATREYQDPRLLKRLEFGDPEEHLPALFIANREEGHAIVARLQQMLKEEPRQVHHLPRLQTTLILATRRFVRTLVADTQVDIVAPPDQELRAGR